MTKKSKKHIFMVPPFNILKFWRKNYCAECNKHMNHKSHIRYFELNDSEKELFR